MIIYFCYTFLAALRCTNDCKSWSHSFPKSPSVMKPTQHERLGALKWPVSLLLYCAIPLGQNKFYKDERCMLMFPCSFASRDSRIYEPRGDKGGSSQEDLHERLWRWTTHKLNTQHVKIMGQEQSRRLNVFDYLFLCSCVYSINSDISSRDDRALDAREAGFWRQALQNDLDVFCWDCIDICSAQQP